MASTETMEERLAMFEADAGFPPEPENPPPADGDYPATAGESPAWPDYTSEKLFSFPIRGYALNPILDASHSLLALALRLQNLTEAPADIENLHKRLINEIKSIKLELSRLAYDRATVMAHRYCLCAFLDESIMAHSWAEEANWANRSLLSKFHEETWAGDKFFTILDRMMMEPQRYLHLLEFLYICLCLGYEGKFGTYTNEGRLLESVIRETHDVIRKAKGLCEPLAFASMENVVDIPHAIKWRTPVAAVIAVTMLAAGLIYAGFFLYTDRLIDRALVEIMEILGK